jgi:hypothetical protein
VYPSHLSGGGECRSNKRVGRGRYIRVARDIYVSVHILLYVSLAVVPAKMKQQKHQLIQ